MIKISHESPNQLFSKVQSLTDFDYCLVHLLEQNTEYREHFLQAKEKGRQIILDNSIFELGTAFNPDKYLQYVKLLQPTFYILPDSLENSEQTIFNAQNWFSKYDDASIKYCRPIAVVQGKTYQELVTCYNELVKLPIQMIAVSFDYSYYENMYPKLSKLQAWSLGRTSFLRALSKETTFRKDIPLHLLGCSVYTEFSRYKDFEKDYGMRIYSLDTSNPVVAGLCHIKLHKDIDEKPSIKLFELIDTKVDTRTEGLIVSNILEFKNSIHNA